MTDVGRIVGAAAAEAATDGTTEAKENSQGHGRLVESQSGAAQEHQNDRCRKDSRCAAAAEAATDGTTEAKENSQGHGKLVESQSGAAQEHQNDRCRKDSRCGGGGGGIAEVWKWT